MKLALTLAVFLTACLESDAAVGSASNTGTGHWHERGNNLVDSGAPSKSSASTFETSWQEQSTAVSASCKNYCASNSKSWEAKCTWDGCAGCTDCETFSVDEVISLRASTSMNARIFGLGDAQTKAKDGARYFDQLKTAVRALGSGQGRFPGGAVANYWDLEKATTADTVATDTLACPAPGFSGFTQADVGKSITIKSKKTEVDGVSRSVPWDLDLKIKNCDSTIVSVNESESGKVELADGTELVNPGGATQACTCQTMVCPKKGKTMCMLKEQAEAAPKGELTLSNYLKEIVSIDSRAQMPIIVLNLVTMPIERTKEIIEWLGDNLDQLRADAGTARATSEPILIELGNEFYLDDMYGCKLGSNTTEYVSILKQIVPSIRANLPSDTRIGIVGYADPMMAINDWTGGIWEMNTQLKDSGILEDIDAITLHDYSLNKNVAIDSGNKNYFGRVLNESERASAVAAWGAAAGENQAKYFVADGDGYFAGKKAWVTEYGILQKNYAKSDLLSSAKINGVQGLFVLGKLLTAVRHSDVFDTLLYFNLGWANFGGSRMLEMGEVMQEDGAANTTAYVNSIAQMFAHVSSVALPAETMHGVDTVGGPRLPFHFLNFGETEGARCIQAAVFSNATAGSASAVIINRCQSDIDVPVDMRGGNSTGVCAKGTKCSVTAWLYPAKEVSTTDSEWVPLPSSPEVMPWSTPLQPSTVELAVKHSSGRAIVPAPALSLSIATFTETTDSELITWLEESDKDAGNADGGEEAWSDGGHQYMNAEDGYGGGREEDYNVTTGAPAD